MFSRRWCFPERLSHAGGERRGSVGHLLCAALRLSDDETPTEPLNLCIADELAAPRLTHPAYSTTWGRAEPQPSPAQPSRAELLLSKSAGCVRPRTWAHMCTLILQTCTSSCMLPTRSPSPCLWRDPSRTPKQNVRPKRK